MNVRPYTLIQIIDGKKFSGTIYATNKDHAELIVSRIDGAYLDGEDYCFDVCPNCGAVMWSGSNEVKDEPRGH